MKKMDKYSFNGFVAMLATFFTYILGGYDLALGVLFIFMILDYLSGVIYGITQQKLSSAVGFKGIAKKVMIIGLVAVAYQMDLLLGSEALVFRTLVCYFYIANEGISILENASNLGLPVPKKLKNILIQLKEKAEEE